MGVLMLKLEIKKIRDGSYLNSLRRLCSLRSDFRSSAETFELIFEIEKLYNHGKAANGVQNRLFEIFPEDEEPEVELKKAHKKEFDASLAKSLLEEYVSEKLKRISFLCYEVVPQDLEEELSVFIVFEERNLLLLVG